MLARALSATARVLLRDCERERFNQRLYFRILLNLLIDVSTHLRFLNGRVQHHHSGPYHIRIVFTMEAREGPNIEDRAGRLVATTLPLLRGHDGHQQSS